MHLLLHYGRCRYYYYYYRCCVRLNPFALILRSASYKALLRARLSKFEAVAYANVSRPVNEKTSSSEQVAYTRERRSTFTYGIARSRLRWHLFTFARRCGDFFGLCATDSEVGERKDFLGERRRRGSRKKSGRQRDMADAKLRNRQESTDSASSSSNTTEEYSEDDKDNEMDDLNIIKTVGTLWIPCHINC
ncbi:hypothetical protein Trydic_g13441 [Trypoxylus dichotomus]